MSRLPVFQHPPPIACLVAVLATLATPGTARAADSEPDAPETSGVTAGQPGRQSAPDFLFGRPRSGVGVAWGWRVASQSGGIFDFTRDLLTVDEGDFDTGMFRLEAGLSIGPRLDVLAEVGFSGSAIASEYRDEVETVVDTAVSVSTPSVAVIVVTPIDLPIVQAERDVPHDRVIREEHVLRHVSNPAPPRQHVAEPYRRIVHEHAAPLGCQ